MKKLKNNCNINYSAIRVRKENKMDNTFFHIVTYFVIYSFLGWVLESIVRTICERKIINTGFLIGPFCPIYGFGAIIMILFLDRFKSNVFLLFFISVMILTLWEYIVGVLLEKLFSTKYWDYSDHKFNYKGRICLTNSIAWGILGVLFINYIHPFIIHMLGYVDYIYIEVITSIIACILLIDAIISVIKVKNIKGTLEKIEEINEQIKQKLSELKDKEKLVTEDNLQKIVNDLKTRRDRTMKHLYRRAYRLKKAFPAINTKEFTEILSKKMDFKHIKTKKKKKGE